MLGDIYYEYCNNHYMPTYPFFLDKLKQIQKIVKPFKGDINLSMITKQASSKWFKLGNICWPGNMPYLIKHNAYPSEYFIKMILNLCVINDHIVNEPIQIKSSEIPYFSYIPLHYNKLLIIDALMKEGSYPRYENQNKYIYSEHSGVISIGNKRITNIIVSADTDRIDVVDKTIFLPNNTANLSAYEYFFHTHPNTLTYAGRIKDGILYEFPSASDLLNFVTYYNTGKAQASLVVAPEGE